jgi:pyruvate,orthophosphate dikinase
MIEIPRAAVTADEIAREAEFFSFGTNDLTQMTYGFSRDDAGKFLEAYYAKRSSSPTPSTSGPARRGKLIKLAASWAARPAGHQAGHLRRARRRPVLRHFCHNVGLDT